MGSLRQPSSRTAYLLALMGAPRVGAWTAVYTARAFPDPEVLFSASEVQLADKLAKRYVTPISKIDPVDWETSALDTEYSAYFGARIEDLGVDFAAIALPDLGEKLIAGARDHYASRVEQFGEENFARLERFLLLDTVDRQWKDHLLALDHLREGIGLRAYGQRNPLVEYKRESYALFEDMWEHIEDHVVKFLYHAEPVEKMEHRRQGVTTTMSHPEAQALKASHDQQERAANTPVGQPSGPTTIRRQQPKVGRNDPCPCGSGKKYKKCHGASSGGKGVANE
jgi:preprotein translocase subunit SecA